MKEKLCEERRFGVLKTLKTQELPGALPPLRHTCNQTIQNRPIVTWGQNTSSNIEEFACISKGGLFSGVPLRIATLPL